MAARSNRSAAEKMLDRLSDEEDLKCFVEKLVAWLKRAARRENHLGQSSAEKVTFTANETTNMGTYGNNLYNCSLERNVKDK